MTLRPVCWLLLALLAALQGDAAASHNTTQQHQYHQQLHMRLSPEEKIMLFGFTDKVPEYQVISAPHVRRRRSTGLADISQQIITLNVFGDRLRLRLRPTEHLLSPYFQSMVEGARSQTHWGTLQPRKDCLMQGRCVPTSTPCQAALSLCSEMRGLVETRRGTYYVQPVPRSWEANEAIHRPRLIVVNASEPYVCPHKKRRALNPVPKFSLDYDSPSASYHSGQQSWTGRSSRNRRAVPHGKPVIIETAVFVDQALHEVMKKSFPADTGPQLVNYVLTIMNAVQQLYQQSTLQGRGMELSLVLLDILENQPPDLPSSDNIDTYLTNFCVWQHKKRMYLRSGQPRWDHALLLSGINMYVVDERGRRKRHVVGLAPVSGMCNPLNSCTISEGTSFQTVLVAGHEIGHSLGMEHDGPQDGNLCDPNHFIMSPTLGSGKTTWSSCSRDYLEKFLRSGQSHCLVQNGGGPSYPLQTRGLPGQLFDADQQCALRYGQGSRRSLLQAPEEVCRVLRCETGVHGTSVSFTAHPALEGTACGPERWCRAGRCTPRVPIQEPGSLASSSTSVQQTQHRSVHGAWSSWSPYSVCFSDCVARDSHVVGIRVSRRKCDSPTPRNGGRFCDGNDRRSRLCDPYQVCASTGHMDLEQFVSDTCRRASMRDPSIEPRGTQFPSNDNSHSCYVWCRKRSGGYMTHGWKVPDGTPCWRPGIPGNGRHNRFCISGKCQAFDCDGQSTDSMDPPHCAATSVVTAWSQPGFREASECRGSCLEGSKGMQTVRRCTEPTASCESFRICEQPECEVRKSLEDFAHEVCRRYSTKYPNLLSGRGRQLPSRAGNRDSACVVACQDRVWKDTHYQMDVFEDGKFPFGTDCSGGENGLKAHCVHGRCMEFDERGFPRDKDFSSTMELRRIFRGATPSSPGVWKRDTKPRSLPSDSLSTSEDPQWGVSVTECSVSCGGGEMSASLFCHKNGSSVSRFRCTHLPRPLSSQGRHSCNDSPCTGRWRVGEWGPCSGTCGPGPVRSRSVICVQFLEDQVYTLLEPSLCPSRSRPPSVEICILPTCNRL